MTPDQESIRAWLGGDQRAATALVERHSLFLRRVAFSAHVRTDIDELVQDVFVRAFNAIGSFRGDKGTFRTWLVVIMRRLIIDQSRVQRRANLLDSLEAADHVATEEPSALEDVIESETRSRLLDALRSADRKRLLEMRLAGYSWRDIASEFGVEEVSARVRFTRIRRDLRNVAA